ncbi:hypothetical protein CISG_02653 [Coccidioides immitis RMSCC 3703]|uniref:Uncharacterized protein n=2 Tax=Coccidioides immitis TaxID=5501 RepID=A0A0J8R8Q6_COCIT|nr:hypothetical protein CIRG_09068 [Coccidioides immitis RMSCC 2394]KMU81276.1 hypothetical protein CISG_02653 [Coccidioides immitis RMSCC 3703]
MVPVNRRRQANEAIQRCPSGYFKSSDHHMIHKKTNSLRLLSKRSSKRFVKQAQTTNRLKQRTKHKNPLTAQAQSIRPVGRPGTSAGSMDA